MFVLLLLVAQAFSRRARRVVMEQLAAYRRGDYEEQLRIVEGLRRNGEETPAYLFFHGKALYELGRLQEAEASIRKGQVLERDARMRAYSKDALGQVLLELGRYGEAIEAFESSLGDSSGRGCCHAEIATALLRRGGQPAEALRRARKAVEIDERARALTREIHDLNLSESLAALAWAVAAYSGDGAEVERLVGRSLALCPETTRPIRAEVLFHAGMAYAALGREEESARYFASAAETDPRGNFGRLARGRAW